MSKTYWDTRYVLSVSREVSGGVSRGVSGGVSREVSGGVSGSMVLSDSWFHTRCSGFHVCHFHPVHDSLGYISKGIKVF